jgi:hypothetical protein
VLLRARFRLQPTAKKKIGAKQRAAMSRKNQLGAPGPGFPASDFCSLGWISRFWNLGKHKLEVEKNAIGNLVAETGADSHALAADSAAAAENRRSRLGLHARAETVDFHTFTAIGLKSALGHENSLLFLEENLRLNGDN